MALCRRVFPSYLLCLVKFPLTIVDAWLAALLEAPSPHIFFDNSCVAMFQSNVFSTLVIDLSTLFSTCFQWRKKATLYSDRVVLIPLGDDFRYKGTYEANPVFTNYQWIIDYINTHPELHAHVRSGLTD